MLLGSGELGQAQSRRAAWTAWGQTKLRPEWRHQEQWAKDFGAHDQGKAFQDFSKPIQALLFTAWIFSIYLMNKLRQCPELNLLQKIIIVVVFEPVTSKPLFFIQVLPSQRLLLLVLHHLVRVRAHTDCSSFDHSCVRSSQRWLPLCYNLSGAQSDICNALDSPDLPSVQSRQRNLVSF